MHLHSAVLHLELVVVEPNVLHVRIPVPGVFDLGHHLLGNDGPVVLLPPMCGGLSLVVAKFPDEWLHCSLSLRLLLSLLRHEASNQRRPEHVLILRIHFDYGVPLLPPHRIHRVLRLLLVHSKDLQRRQSGLNICLNLI